MSGGKCYIEAIQNHSLPIPLMNNLPRPVIQHCFLRLVSLGLHHKWFKKSIKTGFSLFHSRRVGGGLKLFFILIHQSTAIFMMSFITIREMRRVLLPVAPAVDPVFYLPRHPWGAPLPLLGFTVDVHTACQNQAEWGKIGVQVSTRALCQISTVLSRKSDILHRLDSIIIMVFCRSLYPVCLLSLSPPPPLSLSSSVLLLPSLCARPGRCWCCTDSDGARSRTRAHQQQQGNICIKARLRPSSPWIWN